MNAPYPGRLHPQDIDKEQRQRIALVLADVVLYTGVLLSFVILYIAILLQDWHLYTLYGGNLLFLVLAYAGTGQIRKNNNVTRGIIVITSAIQLTISLLPLLFTEIGILIGLFSFMIASLVITQTLTPETARKTLPVNALMGLLPILFGYVPVPFRIPIPIVLISIIAIVAILETTLLITIIWLQFRSFNIQTKLIVAFITLLVASLIVTGSYNIIASYQNQRAQISASLENDLSAKRAAIIEFMEAARQDIAFLGQTEVLQSYIKTLGDIADPNIVIRARTVMEREFRRFSENRGIYEEVRFIDIDGNEVIRIRTDENGVSSIVPQADLAEKGELNIETEQKYFNQSLELKSGEIFKSPLELNIEDNQIKTPHEPVIYFGTPLIINTQRKGVVLAEVYGDKLLEALSASGVDSFLVDKDGYYLYHPDESKRWGRDLKTDAGINADFPDIAGSLYSGAPGNREVDDYLITYVPVTLPNEDAPVWYIGSFIPTDALIRPIFTSTFNALTLLLVTMSLSIFAMTFLSGTITTPLKGLTITAQDIATGNLNARVNVNTQDEIGVLAGAFNAMTSQLKELVTGLETRVSDRTQELENEKKQTETRARQFEAITRVSSAISATQNLQNLLPQISQVISEQFGFYHVGIFLNDPTNQVAVLAAANSEGGQRMLQRNHQLKIGEQGIVGYVTQAGEPRISLDVGDDAVYFNNPDLPSTHSEMALPLRIGGQIIGALDIQSTETGAFTAENVETLSALADQVSLAIQNARLFDQTLKALAEFETIQRQYTRETWSRLPKEEKLGGYRYTLAGALPLGDRPGDAAKDASQDKREVAVPIVLRGETIGTLSVHIPSDNYANADQIDLIKAVAERVALSAENARLFEETTRRAERERIISDIASKIGTSVRTESILRTAAAELSQLLDNAEIFINLQTAQKNKPGAE